MPSQRPTITDYVGLDIDIEIEFPVRLAGVDRIILNDNEHLVVKAKFDDSDLPPGTNITYVWNTTADADLDLYYKNNECSLYPANFTYRQERYSISVDVQVEGMNAGGFSRFTVFINQPPIAGTCTVQPDAGESYSTYFNITCVNFYDVDGTEDLTYSFSVANFTSEIDFSDGGQSLRGYRTDPSYDFQSSGGNYVIIVTAKDSVGSVAHVLSNPFNASAPSTEAVLEFLNNTSETLQSDECDLDCLASQVNLVNPILDDNDTSGATEQLVDDMLHSLMRNTEVEEERSTDDAALSIELTTSITQNTNAMNKRDLADTTSLTQSLVDSILDNDGTISKDVAKSSLAVVGNLFEVSDTGVGEVTQEETKNFLKDNVKLMDQIATGFATDQLVGQAPLVFESPGMKVQSLKVSKDDPNACSEKFTVPPGALANANNDALTCVDSEMSSSTFNEASSSNERLSEVYSMTYYDAHAHPSGSRRQLQTELIVTVEGCDPIVFPVPTAPIVEGNNSWSICDYYDYDTGNWTSDGCVVKNQTRVETWCSCMHLTSFGIGAVTMVPEFNMISLDDLANLGKMFDNPTGLITILMIQFFIIYVALTSPYVNDKPFLSFPKVWEYNNQRVFLDYSYLCQMLTIKDSEELTFLQKVYKLFWLEIKNNHPLLINRRDPYGNFGRWERWILTQSGILTVMAGSAIFYGQSQGSMFQELAVIIILSMMSSIMPMIISYIISHSDPGEFLADEEETTAYWQWTIRDKLTFGLCWRQKSFDKVRKGIHVYEQKKMWRKPTGLSVGLEIEVLIQEASELFFAISEDREEIHFDDIPILMKWFHTLIRKEGDADVTDMSLADFTADIIRHDSEFILHDEFQVWFVKQALAYGRFWYPTDPACFEEMPDYLEELNSDPPRVLEPEGWLMGEGILEFQKNQLPENVPYIKGWYTCKSSGILYESAKRSSRVVLIAPRGSMLYVKYIIDLGGDYMGYTDFGWLMLANALVVPGMQNLEEKKRKKRGPKVSKLLRQESSEKYEQMQQQADTFFAKRLHTQINGTSAAGSPNQSGDEYGGAVVPFSTPGGATPGFGGATTTMALKDSDDELPPTYESLGLIDVAGMTKSREIVEEVGEVDIDLGMDDEDDFDEPKEHHTDVGYFQIRMKHGRPVPWHASHANDLEFLRKLFGDKWEMIGQCVNHSGLEAHSFYKYCKFIVEEHDLDDFEEIEPVTGDAIIPYWDDVKHNVLVTRKEGDILNDVQAVLEHHFYPFSNQARRYAIAFTILWILGCDLLVLVYGIQFDLMDLYELTQEIIDAVSAAKERCPTDYESAMDYFYYVQYQQQQAQIDAEEAAVSLNAIFKDAEGSLHWLLTVISSMLLSWVVWSPLSMLGKSVYSIFYWDPYEKKSPERMFHEAEAKGQTIVEIEINDLIFQPHVVLVAQRMLYENFRQSTGRKMSIREMEKSYAQQTSLYATCCALIGSLVAFFASTLCCMAAEN